MDLKFVAREFAKRIVYRSPIFNWVSRPRYSFGIDPIQLAFLVDAIDKTRHLAGNIVEVGVARGMTTVFLKTHMQRSGDARRYICADTFSGFVSEHIEYERNERGKTDSALNGFAYLDVDVFRRNMRRCGFDDVKIVQKDCAALTKDDVGDISVALLDVDLYLPTKRAIGTIYDALLPGGIMMVDDVKMGVPYDGAGAAYFEFCKAANIAPQLVGDKGGVLFKRH
jgi:O-methyltransferase